jgi:hypothetical protein
MPGQAEWVGAHLCILVCANREALVQNVTLVHLHSIVLDGPVHRHGSVALVVRVRLACRMLRR